jgi:hypothetical protein
MPIKMNPQLLNCSPKSPTLKQNMFSNSIDVSSYASSVSESDSFNQGDPVPPHQREDKLYNIPFEGEPDYQKF